MTALRTRVPIKYKNPDATGYLDLVAEIIENTPIETLEENTRNNANKYKDWLQVKDQHDTPAILIAGGDSINDHIEDIKNLQREGGKVFAMNAASKWARKNGITVDYQVILDAKAESATMVDPQAGAHLFASQCDAKTTGAANNLTLWHLYRPDIEILFPPERVSAGGYVMVGGDSSVGVCALCLVYTQGYRKLHCFGYDTSYRDGKSHGYEQKINDTMPTMPVEWDGKEYTISIAMKEQCSIFLSFAAQLQLIGCNLSLYGDGLLQTMWRSDMSKLSEKDKYRMVWMYPGYRDVSPGANVVDIYVNQFHPTGKVIDFGCGTGKAAVKMRGFGLDPHLIDFAENCRDTEAQDFPFMEWDLTQKIPAQSRYGFCTDVMEHIPTKDVETVIKNIMACSDEVFFQISTVDDIAFADSYGAILHNTVRPHIWWETTFKNLGFTINWNYDNETASIFYVVQ